MKTEEKEIAEMLLKEIKDASSKPEIPGDRSPREKAVSCYREFIQAVAMTTTIN